MRRRDRLPDFSERDPITWDDIERIIRATRLNEWFADFERDDVYDASDC